MFRDYKRESFGLVLYSSHKWHRFTVINIGQLLAVPPQNTSRTCPCCEHVSRDNRKTQAQFECIACGYKNNADVASAMNILERGHRLLACGEMAHISRSKKQEPAEVSQLIFS